MKATLRFVQDGPAIEVEREVEYPFFVKADGDTSETYYARLRPDLSLSVTIHSDGEISMDTDTRDYADTRNGANRWPHTYFGGPSGARWGSYYEPSTATEFRKAAALAYDRAASFVRFEDL
jgi:hypothetical protein